MMGELRLITGKIKIKKKEYQSMKRLLILIAVFSGIVSSFNHAISGESEVDKLMELLIAKNLISIEEAAQLRADMAVQKQNEKEKQKEFSLIAEKYLRLSGYSEVRYQNLELKGKYTSSTKKYSGYDGFDFKRARLTLKGYLVDNISYKLQYEFGSESSKMVDADITFELNQFLKFSAGQIRIPFSLDNITPIPKAYMINFCQAVDGLMARGSDIIGNQLGRDLGITANGSFLKYTDAYIFDYAVAMINGAGINVRDNNEEKDFVGRLVIRPFVFSPILKTISIGSAYYAGGFLLSTSDLYRNMYTRERTGVELNFDYKMVTFRSEYIFGKDGEYDKDKSAYVIKSNKSKTKREGFYAQTGVFAIPQKLQAVFRYDTFNANLAQTKDIQTIYTIGANWLFNKWAKFQVNYEIKDEEGTEINNNALLMQFHFGF